MRQIFGLAGLLLMATAASAQDDGIRANLSNPIIVVQDLDASVGFYTQCLGFSQVGGGEITADVSKRTIGAAPDQTARSVYLRGAPLRNREPVPTGFALIEISGGEELATITRPAGSNAAIRGEVMLSLVVEGIEDVIVCAKRVGATILNDVESSSSGKSLIASLVDPGGVRIEMYEYLPDE